VVSKESISLLTTPAKDAPKNDSKLDGVNPAAAAITVANAPVRLVQQRLSNHVASKTGQSLNEISDISKDKEVTDGSDHSRGIPRVLAAIAGHAVVLGPNKQHVSRMPIFTKQIERPSQVAAPKRPIHRVQSRLDAACGLAGQLHVGGSVDLSHAMLSGVQQKSVDFTFTQSAAQRTVEHKRLSVDQYAMSGAQPLSSNLNLSLSFLTKDARSPQIGGLELSTQMKAPTGDITDSVAGDLNGTKTKASLSQFLNRQKSFEKNKKAKAAERARRQSEAEMAGVTFKPKLISKQFHDRSRGNATAAHNSSDLNSSNQFNNTRESGNEAARRLASAFVRSKSSQSYSQTISGPRESVFRRLHDDQRRVARIHSERRKEIQTREESEFFKPRINQEQDDHRRSLEGRKR
jgi:hypothetical protein